MVLQGTVSDADHVQNTTGPNMEFPISASSSVSFGGDKYLHAWLSHKFSGQTGASLTLTSKARQFSSFIVLAMRTLGNCKLESEFRPIF